MNLFKNKSQILTSLITKTIQHTQFTNKFGKCGFIKRFSENIRYLFFCWNKEKFNSTIHDMLSNKMIPDINVLCPRVLHRVVGDGYGTCIVT